MGVGCCGFVGVVASGGSGCCGFVGVVASGGSSCCGFAGAVARGGSPIFWVVDRRLWVVGCDLCGL